MIRVLSVISLVLLFAACEKNKNDEQDLLRGRFTGTFNRTGMDTVEVEFLFNDNGKFEGSGGVFRYPALCSGHYEQAGNSLSVEDTCTWTADFDWSLIFDGNYSLSFNSDESVRIWRTNGTVTDEYILKKFTR